MNVMGYQDYNLFLNGLKQSTSGNNPLPTRDQIFGVDGRFLAYCLVGRWLDGFYRVVLFMIPAL